MIVKRIDFAGLLASRNLYGSAVEVGAHRGDFCSLFYSQWGGKSFYCVDRYVTDKGIAHWQDHAQLTKKMDLVGKPWKFIGQESTVAATFFPDGFFDFVYIDAGHNYNSVFKDLRAWWPKLKNGGLFAGHDFFDGSHAEHVLNADIQKVKTFTYGVRSAVTEFAKYLAVDVLTTQTKREGISWYWFKL